MREDIVSFARENDEIPFYVSMCGISYCDGGYKIERINSPIYVIEYIVSGTGIVWEDNQSFCASEGDIYFLKRGRRHFYYSDAENPWTKIWFNFEGKLAGEIASGYGLDKIAHFHAPELKEYFMEAFEISRSGEGGRIISDNIAAVYLKLVQKLSYNNIKTQQNLSAVAEGVKEYIDNTTDYTVSMDEIAKKVYCSKCHAIREFRKVYGVTPYEYMLKKRFEIAASMLKNTALSISDIAEKLGFCDVHYFSGCFSKRFGVPPTAYRKK